MSMNKTLLAVAMMAATGSAFMPSKNTQVVATGKALYFPPEQPKLSKKAKAKAKKRKP